MGTVTFVCVCLIAFIGMVYMVSDYITNHYTIHISKKMPRINAGIDGFYGVKTYLESGGWTEYYYTSRPIKVATRIVSVAEFEKVQAEIKAKEEAKSGAETNSPDA